MIPSDRHIHIAIEQRSLVCHHKLHDSISFIGKILVNHIFGIIDKHTNWWNTVPFFTK